MNRIGAETVTIILPMPPTCLQPNHPPASAGGRIGKAKATKKQRAQARTAVEECGVETGPWSHASVSMIAYHKTVRRRDVANYWGALKGAIDGVVDGGLLVDDDSRHLHYGGARFEIDRDSPQRIELTFTRLSPAGFAAE